MNWFYVDAGQQAGPVDDAQLAELARSGKLQSDTLVWREGMGNWRPYSEVAAGSAVPPVVGPVGGGSSVFCSECGRAFAPGDVIRYENKWICAACKPVFFQRVREGAAMAPPLGTVSEADLLGRDYEVDIGGCLSRGWETFKANAGIMIGASLLVYLALMASNMIPYLGVLVGLFLNGPLMGGLWLFYIRRLRGHDAGVGDAFGGFGPRFWQLMLTQFIPTLIVFVVVFGAAMVGGLAMVSAAALHRGGPSTMASTLPAVLIPILLAVALVAVVMTYLNTCWLFALPLVGDKGLPFWPAMELSRRVVSKHWWMNFWLFVVAGLLAMAGMLACGFGLLVTGPVAFAMIASHYEKVFGDLAPSQT
jgi:hypothetical protein